MTYLVHDLLLPATFIAHISGRASHRMLQLKADSIILDTINLSWVIVSHITYPLINDKIVFLIIPKNARQLELLQTHIYTPAAILCRWN